LLGKERVRLVRKLADRIGETVLGVQEIHAHDTSNLELADFSNRLGTIFDTRYKIYRQKFVIKFINNFIQQLGPFFFYAIGGYLVITGGLDIGTLIAAIAAHKDLAGPWKELLTYYQMKEDARIKYDQVTGQFQPAGMRDESYQLNQPDQIPHLEGELATNNLTLTDDQDVNVLDSISLNVGTDQHVAIVGPAGSGKEDLALLLARLIEPSKGRILVNGADLGEMSEAVTGRRISFVGASNYIFAGTLGDNLFYGLKHRPAGLDQEDSRGKNWVKESEASGNITYDVNADWIDYASIGVDGAAGLRVEALRVLKMVDLVDDVYQLGLRGTIDPAENPELAEAILRARTALLERSKDPDVAALIESFDRQKYNSNATVGENLMFGNPIDERFDVERLAENEYVLSVLDKVGLTEQILSIGYQVAATMVELFADVPSDHELFQQFSFISAEDLPDFQALVTRIDRDSLDKLVPQDRASLLSLPFKLIPARHRLGLLNEEMQAKILEAREVFARDLPEELGAALEFFDLETYNRAANLQDNILFGKIAYGQAEAGARVGRIISEVIEELDLRGTVAEVGLGFDVGIAGSRLGAAQRQKLAIARAALKKPDVLILSEATASLDGGVQTRILANLIAEFKGRGLIWSLHRADLAKNFDRIIVMKGGKAVEVGTYDELNRDGTGYKELMAAE
ncbi:MAG: ABC transporter ATP-binding protein, partial [Proteobacteria bacterium]|nr:ABC transporter ATP-binding protein [Pseudomonadota bacterium]